MTLLLADGAARLSDPAVWETAVARWLLFAGLSVALGGLAGRGLARQYKGTFPVPLPTPWALRGSLLGVAASAWLALIAVGGAGLVTGFAHVPRLLHTTAGTIAGVEFAAFVIAAGLLRLRQPGAAVLPLLAVVAAEGVRAHPESIIPVAGALITYCHLLPAAIWAGMLFYTLRAALAWRYHPADMRGLMRLYATAAAWLFTVIVVTGIISALVLVPLRSLTTTYGLVLIAKAALVAAAAGLAVAGRIWLRRHPQPGAGPALATKVECGTIAAVLALTGLLTALTPPAAPVRPAAAIRQEPAQR
ncbi:MAG TPA: CopD family protein [Streptosporangiaceae bacterium]|nr:CopD family protein [Streptosporangiaceae bacterium]